MRKAGQPLAGRGTAVCTATARERARNPLPDAPERPSGPCVQHRVWHLCDARDAWQISCIPAVIHQVQQGIDHERRVTHGLPEPAATGTPGALHCRCRRQLTSRPCVQRALREWKEGVPSARPAPAAKPDLVGAVGPARTASPAHVIAAAAPARRSKCCGPGRCASSRSKDGQCADFNCFNLHDYKEFMHVRPHAHAAWLQPRPGRLPVVGAAARARDDVHPGRHGRAQRRACSRAAAPTSTRSVYGFSAHTNCHDIQAEAQREYGLTPDDVHDSLQPLHVHRRSPEGAAASTRQDVASRRPRGVARADGRAGRAQRVRRRRHAHQQLLAQAPEGARCSAPPERDLARVPLLGDYDIQPHAGAVRAAPHQGRPRAAARRSLRAAVHQRADRAARARSAAERRRVRDPRLVRTSAVLRREDLAAQLRDVLFSWWEKRYLA